MTPAPSSRLWRHGASAPNPGAGVGGTHAPAGLSFYVPPAPLPAGPPGEVIWARRLTGAATLDDAAENLLVLYHSRTVAGHDTAVSGTVSLPRGRPPADGWPALSWAHGTTGIADVCAPSRDGPGHPAHIALQLANSMLNQWVQRGWAVVQTDYEGLGTPGLHPYLIGTSEARGTADILTAARQLSRNIGTRWATMGHSRGGHAALFAASLAQAMVPDLDLIGVVAMAPSGSAGHLVPAGTDTEMSAADAGFLLLAVGGAAAADATVRPGRLLTPSARRVLAAGATGVDDLIAAIASAALVPRELFRDGADLTPLLKVLTDNDPAALRLGCPALIVQGNDDLIVARRHTRRIAHTLRANGAKLDYQEYSGTGHFDVIAAAHAGNARWLDARLSAALLRGR
jgi:pimeloyl-ACP methyl ester carboxylesterase